MIPGTLFGVITRLGVDCLVAQLTAKGKLITDHESGTGRPRSLVTGRDTPVFDSIRPTQNQFKAAGRFLPSFGKAYDRIISIGRDARSLYHATKGKSRPVPVMRTAMQAFMSMFTLGGDMLSTCIFAQSRSCRYAILPSGESVSVAS